MAEDDLSVITDPKRRKLLEDIRGIGAQFKAPPKGSAPNRFDPLMPHLGVHNKAQVLGADAAAIDANGLPGYTDPTARMAAGMASGPIQFNMPGPNAIDVGPGLPHGMIPGSMDANNYQKFRALMGAPGTPEEEAVKAAVASRQPNLGLTYDQFNTPERQEKQGDAKQAYKDAMALPAAPEKGSPIPVNREQEIKDANRQLFEVNPTAAAANTYLRNRAQRAGMTPEALLANNAKRAEARKAAPVPTPGGAPNKFGPLMNPAGFDMNLARQDITNGFRQGGPAGGQLALDLHLGKMRQDMAAQELAMQQRNSDVHNRVAEGELALKKEAANPEAIGARAAAEQDPAAAALEREFAAGKLTPKIQALLAHKLEENTGLFTPIRVGLTGSPRHRAWAFSLLANEFPGLTRELFNQFYGQEFPGPQGPTAEAPNQPQRPPFRPMM